MAREVAIPAMLRRRQCLGHSTACGKDHGFNRMRQTNSEHALSKDAAMQPQTPELLNVLHLAQHFSHGCRAQGGAQRQAEATTEM